MTTEEQLTDLATKVLIYLTTSPVSDPQAWRAARRAMESAAKLAGPDLPDRE